MSRYQEDARLVARRELGGGYYALVLESPQIAAAARAGQFALLGTRATSEPLVDPLLLRPFSFLDRRPDEGLVELFFRDVGRGTALLARLAEGTQLRLLGPLGTPWPEPEDPVLALVAGGVGMPPLLDLARSAGGGRQVHVFYGGRSAAHLHLLDRFEAAGVRLHLTTDDGSAGTKGTNVEALEAWLAEDEETPTLYACGPEGMLRATAALAKRRSLTAFVSVEAPMACGIGVCRGCAVPHAEGGYRMACADGPVFRAEEVYP